MPEVEVEELSKRFGMVQAVDHIHFKVADGMLMTLLGPSGCGKSTTLRCVAGLEKPDSGLITVGGHVISSSKDGRFTPPEKRGIGMVFQSYAIWPHMTVFDNVAYPLKVRHVSRNEIKKKVKEVLALVRLEGLEDRLAPHLSGGQQQRVALARALVADPKLLLLDEPMSNLDARLREHMRSELKDLQRRLGIATIYVTHDQIEALYISHTIGVMMAGKILETGTPRDIYSTPKTKTVAEFVGTANFIEGEISKEPPQNGYHLVETPLAPLYCHIPDDVRSGGGKVTLCARPEHVAVHRSQPLGKVNILKGKVTQAVFLGEYTEYRIDIEGHPIRVHSYGAHPVEDGEPAYVEFPPDRFTAVKFA